MSLNMWREEQGPGCIAGPVSNEVGKWLREIVLNVGLGASIFRPGNFHPFPNFPTPVQWQIDCVFQDTSLINMRLAMESRVLGGKWLVIMIRRPASEKESWCG